MASLRLEIVTPDNVVLGTDVDYVGAPGVDGEFGVLAGHIPLITALKIGSLYYRQGDVTSWVFIAGGFAEIAHNKVIILAEAAELAVGIDVERAEKAKVRSKERLTLKNEDVDFKRAELALQRSLLRLSVTTK